MNIKIETQNGDYTKKMNQKVKIDLLDFAEIIGAELQIRERLHGPISKKRKLKKYYAHFINCESKEGLTLVGYSGDGNTINKALADYAKQISNKLLVFDSNAGCMRRQIYSPTVIYSPSKKIKKWFDKVI